MDLRKIAAVSAYIGERQASNDLLLEADGHSHEKYQVWERLLNTVPGKKIFETRLEQDGITQSNALDICGTASFRQQVKLPVWASILESIADTLNADKDVLWKNTAVKKEEIELEGPISAFLPLFATEAGYEVTADEIKTFFEDLSEKENRNCY